MTLTGHQKRWVTVFAVVPALIVYLVFMPTGGLAVLLAVVAALALWEYFKNFCRAESPLDFGYILAVALSCLIFWAAYDGSFMVMFLVLWLALFVFAGRAMIRFNQGKTGFEKLTLEALSILYIPCLLSSLLLLRRGEDGVAWLFFPLFLAFLSDTGAFYAGTYLGKHKLIPRLSPAKTVEGSLGSIVFDVAVVVVFKLFFLTHVSWTFMLVLAVCAALATQMGDLFESMIKRSFQVKDVGGILPGHGGLLDRIDGLLFTGPVVWCFQAFVTY
ncbi:MAG: phosphatidate cytidylyltransferase [Deltaproteobacteria bacterium]|nr:phosphatidate cytidylyltransferase [Deltaproteobacteria bacterium]